MVPRSSLLTSVLSEGSATTTLLSLLMEARLECESFDVRGLRIAMTWKEKKKKKKEECKKLAHPFARFCWISNTSSSSSGSSENRSSARSREGLPSSPLSVEGKLTGNLSFF